MSRIMRQLEAEARAAREAEQRRKEAEQIGADVPSAPTNADEQIEHAWAFAHVMGHIPRQGGEDG